jgi:diacylglycerol kinase family enzyme
MSQIRPTHSDAASPKLLIFVNPNSGSGTAVKTFKYRIRSFLGEADIFYDLVVTEYPGHCYKYIQSIPDLTVYIGIVAVSGDGLLYEVFVATYITFFFFFF